MSALIKLTVMVVFLFAALRGYGVTPDVNVIMNNRSLSADDKSYFARQLVTINAHKKSLRELSVEIGQLNKDLKQDRCRSEMDGGRCANRLSQARMLLAAKEDEHKKLGSQIDDFELHFSKVYDQAMKKIESRQAEELKGVKEAQKAAEDAAAAEVQRKLKVEQDKAALNKLNGEIQVEFIKLRQASIGFLYDAAKYNAELTRMESTLDSSNLGAYMIGKMTKLLNSKAFCDAKNKCDGKGSEVNYKQLNDVFKSLKDEPGQTATGTRTSR